MTQRRRSAVHRRHLVPIAVVLALVACSATANESTPALRRPRADRPGGPYVDPESAFHRPVAPARHVWRRAGLGARRTPRHSGRRRTSTPARRPARAGCRAGGGRSTAAAARRPSRCSRGTDCRCAQASAVVGGMRGRRAGRETPSSATNESSLSLPVVAGFSPLT